MLVVFLARELRISYPLWNIRLFSKNRVFLFSNLAALINYGATFAVTFFLSLYLQYIMGYSPEHAGYDPRGPAGGHGAGLPGSRAPSRTGLIRERLPLPGWPCPHSALSSLRSPAATPPLWVFIGILVLLGAGLGLFSSPNTNAIMGSVERSYYGVASGTLGTMRLGGQMLSMGLAMMVLAIFVGNVPITPALYPAFVAGMKISMGVFAAMCCAGIFFSLVRYAKPADSDGFTP